MVTTTLTNGGRLHAAQRHGVDDPQHDRRADDRGNRCAALEPGEEVAQRREQQDQVGHVADPGRHPVAERRREADVVAEPGSGIAVDAAVDVGLAGRQCLEDERQHQHADAGDRPSDEERARRGAGRPSARAGRRCRCRSSTRRRWPSGRPGPGRLPRTDGSQRVWDTVSDIVVSQSDGARSQVARITDAMDARPPEESLVPDRAVGPHRAPRGSAPPRQRRPPFPLSSVTRLAVRCASGRDLWTRQGQTAPSVSQPDWIHLSRSRWPRPLLMRRGMHNAPQRDSCGRPRRIGWCWSRAIPRTLRRER